MARSPDRLADDVRLDRQLASAAVDQHGQRDARRPAEVGELVERGADRASGVEHVVDDHDVLAVDVDRDLRLPDDRTRSDRLQVVAIERDVERALWHVGLLAFDDRGYDLRRELNAAALNADDDEIVRAVVQLDDLVGHAPQRSIERARIEHY